jgi:hypothetical protein
MVEFGACYLDHGGIKVGSELRARTVQQCVLWPTDVPLKFLDILCGGD